MKKIIKTIISLVSVLFANNAMQKILKNTNRLNNLFQGVGAGGMVSTSGEEQQLSRIQHLKMPVVFDVGANRGQYAWVAISSLQRAHGVVLHSFEPSGATFKLLEENLNHRVTALPTDIQKKISLNLNNLALGDKPGKLTLYADKVGSGLASFSKRRLDHFKIAFEQQETVSVETIDRYAKKHNITRIDLLKLDVEGHELEVLAGAEKMFREQRIRMVTFEFGGANIDSRTYLQDFWYFFKDYGFELYRITPTGFPVLLKKYSEDLEQFTTTNFLVLPKNT